MDAESQSSVLVGVVMGSRNDYAVMRGAVEALKEFGVAHEVRVVSAHRTPDLLFDYAESAVERGLRVIIAGAGGAAHLPGMIAAKTVVPVLGVPIPATALQLAIAMLATTDAELQKRLIAWRAARRDEVLAQVVGEEGVGE
jgi:5-(carboxyamino)imidazole ribonucleotide mutase